MEATLKQWGNSKAIRIPQNVCTLLGVLEGSKAKVTVNELNRSITFDFTDESEGRYRRTEKVTMEQVMDGWSGPKLGEEMIKDDVGAEVVI